jgi:hypothetical protein
MGFVIYGLLFINTTIYYILEQEIITDWFQIYDKSFTFTNWNKKLSRIEDFKNSVTKYCELRIEHNTI